MVISSSVLIALENGGQENVGDILQTENSENAIGHLCNSDNSACPAEKVIDNSIILVKSTATSASEITSLESSVQENINEIVQTENTIGHLCNSNDSACPAKIDLHEKSIQHIDAIKQQYSNEATYWRNVLKRIIKIILFLTSGNTALRGHEHKGKFNEHEYINEVKLLAEFDPVMNELLNDEKKKIKYLSWKVQNELISILATNVRNLIYQKVQNSQCFSIIVDSTQDITKIDQVSIILRYTILNFDERSLSIEESFLGFYAIDKHGAKDYEDLIISILKALNINISKCRGQGYDGASVMSGLYSGVQKRIKDQVPLAQYVHCCAHNLNLVISDAAKSSKQVTSFFETVQSIFNIFSSSAPQWSILAFGEADAKKIKAKVLKKLCVTRWEARHESIYSLKVRFIDVLKALTNISLTSSKTDEKMTQYFCRITASCNACFSSKVAGTKKGKSCFKLLCLGNHHELHV
ncbi:hypothetical protein QTP88_029495 [Uroleucon formosanum]